MTDDLKPAYLIAGGDRPKVDRAVARLRGRVDFENVEVWKAPDAKSIAEYLRSPAPGTTLALVGGELKKDSPLGKAVGATGAVLVWDVQTRAIHKWIADQFAVH